MVKQRKSSSNKIAFIIIPIISLFLAFSVMRKAVYYSSEPTEDKNCHLLYPFSFTDPSKATTIVMQNPPATIPFLQKGGIIDDISCLNKTSVYGIVKVNGVEDIQNTILFAKENNIKTSIAGIRHSMGGQSFFRNAAVLDMTGFNQMSIDEENKILTVQSGATWHDIQKFLHPKGLAVKAMQSSDIFTVGGSISVNAHGMDHHVGSLGTTIKSMRIMLSDGTIKTVSKTQSPELYRLVIGGYGLFGVILDADIEVTNNEMYERETYVIDYKEFPRVFEEIMASGDKSGLMYGHLSTGPNAFLKEVIIYNFRRTDNFNGQIPPLQEKSNVGLKRLFLNLGKTGTIGRQIRYWAEKYLQPRFESCAVSRNDAMGEPEACFISRNQEMYESGKFLRNNLKNDTDILQEYFIPRDKFIEFVDGMREILQKNKAVVLNSGIRVVNKEDNFLNYAPEDAFAMVLYLNQKMTSEENERMEKLTRKMVDLTISLGGKPYLPYQLYFTDEQLQKAYPNINQFFALKTQYDPNLLFMSSLYEKYSKVRTF
ncbi:FAD-binding oxidoreductase [Candidatus Curtissbacteria bacterium]|nr:FAD-binding oxidoreductase [Candidatus Curtissbacteria bacterium]